MPESVFATASQADATLYKLQRAWIQKDAAMLRETVDAANAEASPALAGLAVRALRAQAPRDVEASAGHFRREVVNAARQLPQWSLLQSLNPPSERGPLAADHGPAWFAQQSWEAALLRFVRGESPATLLAEPPGNDDGGVQWVRSSHTLLSAAILLQKRPMRDFLLMAATDVDAPDSDGHTALWSACEVNDEAAVHLLMAWGAKPSASVADADATPLLFDALCLSSPNIVRAVLADGLDPELSDAEGWGLLDSVVGRRLWAKGPPLAPDRVVEHLLDCGLVPDDPLVRDTSHCFGTLFARLCSGRTTEADAWSIARCAQLLAICGTRLDRVGSLDKLPAAAFGLVVDGAPEPADAGEGQQEPEPAPSADGDAPASPARREVPFVGPPVVLCLLARGRALAFAGALRSRESSEAASSESSGPSTPTAAARACALLAAPTWDAAALADAGAALGHHEQPTPELCAALLLVCARTLAAVDLAAKAAAGGDSADALAWANVLQDDEAEASLRTPVESASSLLLPALPLVQEPVQPPTAEWLDDLNGHRQWMRHGYRMGF